jgi:hypothetical protein
VGMVVHNVDTVALALGGSVPDRKPGTPVPHPVPTSTDQK